MLNVQVEELESRRLLNSAGPQLSLVQYSAAITDALMVVERLPFYDYALVEHLPFVDYGGRGGPQGWGWSGSSEMEIVSFRTFARLGFEANGLPGRHELVHQGSGPARPDALVGGAFWFGADPPAPGPVAGGQDASRNTTGGPTPGLSAPATSGRGTNVAAAEALFAMAWQQPNARLRPTFENVLGARAVPVEVPRASITLSPLGLVRGGESESGSAQEAGPGIGQRQPGSGLSSPDETDSVAPLPKVSEAVTLVPPLDFSALELGMRQFLEQLGAAGPRLALNVAGTPLWPWIVAVVAAGSACEIARRELKRPAGWPALEATGIERFPGDPLWEEGRERAFG